MFLQIFLFTYWKILNWEYTELRYMQSNKIHSFFMIEFYSSRMLARHVSDLTGASSGAFVYKLYVQIWYVVLLCVLLDTSSRYFVTAGWTCRVVRVLPHTKSAHTACKQTLLKMHRWGPKHVELTYVMHKTHSLKHFVYLVGLHIYYKMTHGPYNIKLHWINFQGQPVNMADIPEHVKARVFANNTKQLIQPVN